MRGWINYKGGSGGTRRGGVVGAGVRRWGGEGKGGLTILIAEPINKNIAVFDNYVWKRPMCQATHKRGEIKA